jgi:glucose/arabinose dehydrogenase
MAKSTSISIISPVIAGLMLALALGCATPPSPEPDATTPVDAIDTDEAAIAPSDNASAVDPNSPEEAAIAQAPHTVQAVTIADSLEHPWGMAWLPDGTLLVTERPGRLRIIRNGELDPTPVPGVPDVLAFRQGGLLDIALHPQFEQNQWVYFTYASGTASANQTRVARARFDGQQLSDWTMIFEVQRVKEDGQHFGSRMVWLPDNTLLVSIGDGGNPPVQLDGDWIRNQAQNLDVRLGKIVRLNDDGSIPSNNPFSDRPDADSSIWSYGHRNIQGIAIDSETNQLWATEHGARGGDELNQLQPGENYGWPIVTHSREYSGGVISDEQSRPGMQDPKIVWTPAIAPSGLMIYRGDRFPQWRGQLFAGGLVSRDVRRIEVDANGTVINETPIAIGQRVRDVRQGPDGLIYVLTDDPNGQLIRLQPE